MINLNEDIRNYSDDKQKIKNKARNMIGHAIKKGWIERGMCELCGSYAQAHHVNYYKPYRVKWLCALHHRFEHDRIENNGQSLFV